ncbi:MAG TPA: hypothetical protein VJ912_01910 [Candidatus Nanoarchaeia archaeon]|nr:hypothetical protein [Candidatus Nanoarchaeia archaeon]
MVNQEIVGGIEIAVNRGYSVDDAMISFYNAGYDRNEIEEAARYVKSKKEKFVEETKEQKDKPEEKKKERKIKTPKKKEKPKTKQNVSEYKSHKGRNIIIAIIITLVVIAGGLLIGFLLFREEIIKIMESVFGNKVANNIANNL